MKATLADAALTRYAGRFVWLELDYDKPVNHEFIVQHQVGYFPTMLVLDPATGGPLASHIGGLSLTGLEEFLDQSEEVFHRASRAPADTLLTRAEERLAQGRYTDAAELAESALRAGGPQWADRPRALASLTWGMWVSRQVEACAETAAVEAPHLPRGERFATVVLAGLMSAANGADSPWGRRAAAVLEPLAEEALGLHDVIRDHRFQLYDALIRSTYFLRGDSVKVVALGHRWLDEIDGITPRDDDERSALDIARVDAASDIDEPERVLPALIASERAMPDNYNASLRLAQMAVAAGRDSMARAACARGLQHVTGPAGRSWLLSVEADALHRSGDARAERDALVQALSVAHTIGNPTMRKHNIARIEGRIAALDASKGTDPGH